MEEDEEDEEDGEDGEDGEEDGVSKRVKSIAHASRRNARKRTA